MPRKDSHCSSTTRTDVNSCFLWINMTSSLRKKSYSENTEFNCRLVFIAFPYDDPLSVQETTIANRGNIFGNYFSLSLYQPPDYCIVHYFLLCEVNRDFWLWKRLKLFAQANAERCTEWFTFWRLCFRTGGLKFLISWKVWFSLGMPCKIDLYTFSSHKVILKPIKLTAFLA